MNESTVIKKLNNNVISDVDIVKNPYLACFIFPLLLWHFKDPYRFQNFTLWSIPGMNNNFSPKPHLKLIKQVYHDHACRLQINIGCSKPMIQIILKKRYIVGLKVELNPPGPYS